ncbi:hypothetical protein BKA69DRAFT_1103328, partial [Paraphysoderma sedebokerense]
LTKLQHLSGFTFSSFLSLHLLNHSFTHVSLPFAEKWMLLFREFYQTPVVEYGLGLSVVVHFGCGFIKYLRRRRLLKNEKKECKTEAERQAPAETSEAQDIEEIEEKQFASPSVSKFNLMNRIQNWYQKGWLKNQRRSGWVLSVLFLGHYYATRLAPLLYWGDSSLMDYSYVTLSMHMYPGTFHIYYVILGVSGLYHLINGVKLSSPTVSSLLFSRTSISSKTKPTSRTFYLTLFGSAIVMSSVAALAGLYYPIDVPLKEEFLRMQRGTGMVWMA